MSLQGRQNCKLTKEAEEPYVRQENTCNTFYDGVVERSVFQFFIHQLCNLEEVIISLGLSLYNKKIRQDDM